MMDLIDLAARIEAANYEGWVEAEHRMEQLCRELHDIDPHSNVNGSCAGYLLDLYQAKRLIPKNHCYSICSDVNEVRAVVSLILTERCGGFSAVPHGHFAETRALVAACLRARADAVAAHGHELEE